MGARIFTLCLATTFLAAAPASAFTIRVDWAGSGDYETIQEGLDDASEGDTVLVLPGTYTGAANRRLDFRGLGIVLLGDTGASGTTIDCEEAGRAFLFDDGEGPDAVVEGFTVVNGLTSWGGAIRIDSSSPTFHACVFRDCVSTGNGGAVFVEDGAPAFDGCDFGDNGAVEGGGAVYLDNSQAAFTECSFTGNSAAYGDAYPSEGYHGGAVYLERSAATLAGCSFVENWAERGGAVNCSLPAVPTFDNCAFIGNSSYRDGGAVRLYGCSPTFSDCRFEGNRPRYGGVVFGRYASPTLAHCTFWDNRATYVSGGRDVHLEHTDIWDAVIENCTFCGWSLGSQGGDLLYFEDCAPRVERSVIAFYNHGGAIGCAGVGTPTVTNCAIFDNTGGDTPCGDHYDNLFEDPLVCGFWDGDLSLCENSPCLPANNPWGVLIGAHDEGCGSCASPVERVSWGQIKAMYR